VRKFKLPPTLIATVMSVVVALIVAAFFYQSSHKRGHWEITIATGTKGGTYFPLGQQFARILEKLPEIEKVTHKETSASFENMRLLLESKTDIAFVFSPVIATLLQEDRQKLNVMTRLYTDVLLIVTRKGSNIKSLQDLDSKKIYIGKEGSGTKFLAESIFTTFLIVPSEKVEEGSFEDASRMLVKGELDAAFFVTGKQSLALKIALESGKCSLLDLHDKISEIVSNVSGLNVCFIPANTYTNQTKSIQTVSAEALLLCRNDLDEELVFLIENALFDNIGNLLLAHSRAQDIRLEKAFDNLPQLVSLHQGAQKFMEIEQANLLVATGTYNGKYHDLGKRIQMLLKQRGIRTRVIHTDGSMENIALLTQRPTLAIIQYDVALASYWGAPELFYKDVNITDDIQISEVKGMRRIAVFHTEKVHILMRRDKLPNIEETQQTVQELGGVRVCLGPDRSGTRMLAQAILTHHGVIPEFSTYLSVPDMVDRIQNGEIAAGFFVSHAPSQAVKTLLANEEIRLLSIEPKKIAKLVGPAIKATRIATGTYTCQLEGEPAVETLETRALLVTTEDLPFDVHKITKTIFEGAAFIGIEAEAMAEDLSSIPIHPGAKKYYQSAGYLPSKRSIDWLERAWRLLAALFLLIAGYNGFIHLRRERTAKQQRQRIFEVSVKASEPQAVEKLLNVRRDIRQVIGKKWWHKGVLDETRRRDLDGLVAERISEARENLTMAVFAEIRAACKENELDSKTKRKLYSSLEYRILKCFENGKLDKSQHGFLIGILKDKMSPDVDD